MSVKLSLPQANTPCNDLLPPRSFPEYSDRIRKATMFVPTGFQENSKAKKYLVKTIPIFMKPIDDPKKLDINIQGISTVSITTDDIGNIILI